MKPVRFNKVQSKKGIFIIEGFINERIWLRKVTNKDILSRISYKTFELFYKPIKKGGRNVNSNRK